MSLTALKYEAAFVAIECWQCQIAFGVTPYFQERRREDHQSFYCPAGHSQIYPSKSREEKLQEELAKAERAKQMALDQARMEAEQRQKAERKLKRVQRGVCPQCNRTFAELTKHMQSKHGEKCNQPPKGSKTR
jgi:Zn finger protein HypA/HybF involved in hydrogenase expression